MSVVSVTAKRYEGGDIDQAYVRRYAVVYEVITNDPLDGVITVLNATVTGTALTFYDLIGATYMDQDGATDSGALCTDIHPQKNTGEGDRITWEVRCEFASKARDPAQAIEDPLLRPQEVQWEAAKYTKPVDKALARVAATPLLTPADTENDVAPMSSSREKFLPPIERDQTRRVITVSRNVVYHDDGLASAYEDTVNSDDVTIKSNVYAAGTLKCDSVTGQTVYENGIEYVRQVITLHVSQDGWIVDKLDEGYGEIVSSKFRKITDGNGVPLSAPVPLDGSGVKLATGGTPVFRRYRIYRKAAFSGLNLPA